ncbi:MAG: hypothetical protein E7Z92_01170 [Cyanobacteria bacterium SIG31]|nr:hypothetical protein [Cyanobacteria bacterium SIG31]
MSVLFSTPKAFAEATATQTLYSSVPSAVAIGIREINVGSEIEPQYGTILNDLKTSFDLSVNTAESNGKMYDFYIFARAKTYEGDASAFGPNGVIVFSNISSLPTSTAVANARNGINGNVDVIGYNVKMEPSNKANMNVTFEPATDFEEAYKIKFLNGEVSGTINQIIVGKALPTTFNSTEDTAGTYSVTVYVTALESI